MSARLAHVALFVHDLDRAEHFYSRVLGWRVIAEEPGIRFLGPSASETPLALFECSPDGVQPPLALGCRHVSFEVGSKADLAATFDRLNGARAVLIDTGSRWSVHTTDPDGTRIEIFCRTGRSREATRPARVLSTFDLEEVREGNRYEQFV